MLYIVPTPIGNLEDITLRALKILRQCNVIACENIKHSLKLLSYFNISKTLIHYCSYNEYSQSNKIIALLRNGQHVALISNAGTPAISDPGYVLIKKVIENNMTFEVLPGVSAFVTALVGSGLPLKSFIFCGFLKRQNSKVKKELYKLKLLDKTIIIYESSHRIVKTILLCKEIFGDDTLICVARELTKKFEEFIRGTIDQVIDVIQKKRSLLGEFVILIYNCGEKV
ncbi:MAG: 16S rRNA (cytidine(1402)-2'-O)-methyltransferase [Endomicrobium sp.]|nr:16S rRNA (cytidine(1402)-2'-O)-methyltransferase [Endomicrobium sp.]